MDGKSLDIAVKSEDLNYTRFEFISNGLSINKNQFPHFFDPFFLVNEKLGLSSNLGLVLVNEIIKAHHGRIWIEYSNEEFRRTSTLSFWRDYVKAIDYDVVFYFDRGDTPVTNANMKF